MSYPPPFLGQGATAVTETCMDIGGGGGCLSVSAIKYRGQRKSHNSSSAKIIYGPPKYPLPKYRVSSMAELGF